MQEFDVRLSVLPESTTDEVDGGWLFDAGELALLRRGQEVVADIDGDRYYVTAPITWVAIFNSKVEGLNGTVIRADSAADADEQAQKLRAQLVSPQYQSLHRISVMPECDLPLAWRTPARQARREKDDICAWEHAQVF